jgi:hypothetical protein
VGQAENLRQLIIVARKDYLGAPLPEEAPTVATNLDAETRKNRRTAGWDEWLDGPRRA